MDNTEDIRWLQRFSQFKKAYALLEDVINQESLNVTERAGMIQFFEMAFELSWKLLKDYLEYQGFTEIRGPREAIKQAFQEGIITEGHSWLNALDDRNLTTHTYNEEVAQNVEKLIRENYFPLLAQLKKQFDEGSG